MGGINMRIEGIGENTVNPINQGNKQKAEDLNFREFLSDAISKVDDIQKESEVLNQKLAVGEVDNLHDVVIATEKAELALNLTLEVRNQLIETHDELMRMQI